MKAQAVKQSTILYSNNQNLITVKNLILIFTSKKYFASAQLFLSFSLLFGTWVIYIPFITTKLNLSEGELGFVLLFGAIGALMSIVFGKRAISKIGEGKLALISLVLHTISIVGNFLAFSMPLLCLALFFNGFTSGFLQIGINSVASTIEKEGSIPIMSSCHGFYSLGGIIAAGFGTLLLILFNNPIHHIILMASIVIILQLFLSKYYTPYKLEIKEKYVPGSFIKSTIKNKIIWGLSLVALCVMVTEGAIADWSGLYLLDVVKTSPNMVGLGYAGFSITMTLGRFLGDNFSKKFGAWKVIITGIILSIIGFGFVLAATTFTSILGFAIIGFGFSVVVPEVYRLSSNVKGIEPSSGITFMSGIGYFGFFAGPVALGAIAEYKGLRISFSILLILILAGGLISVLMSRYSLKSRYIQ
jgi:MFS family permease